MGIPAHRRRAYVTILAGDDVNGVVALAKSLKKVESKYPLVVAILPNVSQHHRDILLNRGCIIREIDPLSSNENLSKLRIWEFVEYRKMIYLDMEVQVFENIDNLFDMPGGKIYGVLDCFCVEKWRHKIGFCQYSDDVDDDKVNLAGDGDGGGEEELGDKDAAIYFNTDMFVFEPCISTYHELLKTLQSMPPTPFGEKDILNIFFKNNFKKIPPVYSLHPAMLINHRDKFHIQEVKVFQCFDIYAGIIPNMESDESLMILVKKCWKNYEEGSLDFNINNSSAFAVEADDNKEKEEETMKKPYRAARTRCCSVYHLVQPWLDLAFEIGCLMDGFMSCL